jgi:membrane protein YdbS with pleckstrin-like domain
MAERVAPLPTLITSGVIADRLRVPLHRVQHVLTSRPHIRPVARVGTLRVYDRQAIAMVRHELTAMDARRAEREGEVPHAE